MQAHRILSGAGRLARLGAALLVAMLAVAPVQAAPPIPYSPYGVVKLGGANVADDSEITAWCGGQKFGATTHITLYQGETWYSDLDIRGDDPDTAEKDGCLPGETVTFRVRGFSAAQTRAWSQQSERLDLTATESYSGRMYLPLIRR